MQSIDLGYINMMPFGTAEITINTDRTESNADLQHEAGYNTVPDLPVKNPIEWQHHIERKSIDLTEDNENIYEQLEESGAQATGETLSYQPMNTAERKSSVLSDY